MGGFEGYDDAYAYFGPVMPVVTAEQWAQQRGITLGDLRDSGALESIDFQRNGRTLTNVSTAAVWSALSGLTPTA